MRLDSVFELYAMCDPIRPNYNNFLFSNMCQIATFVQLFQPIFQLNKVNTFQRNSHLYVLVRNRGTESVSGLSFG